ncbi:hypothetical protein [Rhodococcus rhodochrous]|uniref:hypothetical protein n=1 Tax=Rhodococcus rhodochrous TaxID=1829 RepID=UPI001780A6A6|nr:hypothetical protein [Rhodococcus rhodochrous]QOH59928.1 hypothetical protein C6Y44_27980 [Rhodococcus rhodochrous]
MRDSPERRNRIAATVANYYAGSVTLMVSDAGRRGLAHLTMDAESVQRILGYLIAALGGETDLSTIGLPADSTPALQVAVLTQE